LVCPVVVGSTTLRVLIAFAAAVALVFTFLSMGGVFRRWSAFFRRLNCKSPSRRPVPPHNPRNDHSISRRP
jgi:hypothetical protein